MATAVASADGLLSLLSEDDEQLKLFALDGLNKVVDTYWFQVASSIATIETLYEDEDFGHRQMAALVASKVFYHLGELDDALAYALGAGPKFEVTEPTEYVQTILARCIDQYTDLRQREASGETITIDARLVEIVERLFERCFTDRQFEQAVGIALEARRLDKLQEAVERSDDRVRTLTYSLGVCQRLVTQRSAREEVLRLLVSLYETCDSPDWVTICQCLTFLDDAPEVAKVLDELLRGSEDDTLLAYQVAFDLFENEVQSFLLKVEDRLQAKAPPKPLLAPPPAAAAPAAGDAPAAAGDAAAPAPEGMDTDEGAAMVPDPAAAAGDAAGGAPAAPVPEAAPAPAPPVVEAADPNDPEVKAALQYHGRFARMKSVLGGEVPIGLALEFLYSHNHADLQVLKNIKGAVEARNSVCHSATIFSNAAVHCGTSVDTFLRDNLDWLSRATNWAKFSATAGLGVIHKGQLGQSRSLMAPYLPRDGAASNSPYSEGGAMYALGLIHANHGQDIRGFLLDSLRATSNEVIQHGACLGLGIAGMGTNDEELFEEVKGVLYLDNAVAGEAAGLALGLLAVGSASDKAGEMLAYAHDTQHEKIIRGLALGLALVMYGREEGAETLIEQMTRDQDPILRYGGMYVIGLAYRGTANNSAIQKLLHFAVSDVSDDVRRAAVLCLGLVLMNVPEQCPRIVSLLAESFNPHVRYGAAMAVGISCAGSCMKEAQQLLEPLLTDAVDFVRQGALIAMALVLLQAPEVQVAPFRKQVNKFVADKHEEVMCRMGAIMAAGILDAGGRNATVGLRSRSGYFRRTSVVGLAVFTQYWYWYPLSYFLSLSLQPAALIGLNSDLQMPKWQVNCRCKPSTFAYPAPAQQSSAAQLSKLPTAVLSTTARAREKARKKETKKAEEEAKAAGGEEAGAAAMETDKKKEEEAAGEVKGDAAMETDEATPPTDESTPAPPKVPEPGSYLMDNPARVVPAQERFIEYLADSRWQALKPSASGIVVLRDLRPQEKVELVNQGALATQAATAAAGAAAQPVAVSAPQQPAAEEPPPPEPFEYVPS